MHVVVESLLPSSAERAWRAVLTSELLQDVARPLVSIHPVKGGSLPRQWTAGETLVCCCYLFGLVPLGLRTIVFERIDDQGLEIQTRERDALVRRWDHRIRIRPLGDDRCCYTDEIEISAGWLTPVVCLFAALFYRHRQRRWKSIARRLQSGARCQ